MLTFKVHHASPRLPAVFTTYDPFLSGLNCHRGVVEPCQYSISEPEKPFSRLTERASIGHRPHELVR
jgi:hypothetical protein